MRHDGHIRSDWLPLELTRDQARDVAESGRDEALALIDEHRHQLYGSSDWLPSVTTPTLTWQEQQAGKKRTSTVKVRGCDAYRRVMGRALMETVRRENR